MPFMYAIAEQDGVDVLEPGRFADGIEEMNAIEAPFTVKFSVKAGHAPSAIVDGHLLLLIDGNVRQYTWSGTAPGATFIVAVEYTLRFIGLWL